MLEIAFPGAETLRLEALVADFDGTLARDGRLLPGVAAACARLSESLTLHVVTADTHGGVRRPGGSALSTRRAGGRRPGCGQAPVCGIPRRVALCSPKARPQRPPDAGGKTGHRRDEGRGCGSGDAAGGARGGAGSCGGAGSVAQSGAACRHLAYLNDAMQSRPSRQKWFAKAAPSDCTSRQPQPREMLKKSLRAGEGQGARSASCET